MSEQTAMLLNDDEWESLASVCSTYFALYGKGLGAPTRAHIDRLAVCERIIKAASDDR